MNYNCPYAERRHGTILLFCTKRNNDCMNQRFCNEQEEAPAEAERPKKKSTAKKKKTDAD